MERWQKIAVILLIVFVIGGVIYVRGLHKRVTQLERTQATEEQERREVIAPPITTPTDVNVSATLFWISPTQPDQLAPSSIQLPLSADPEQRAKQLIGALIAEVPTPAQRTLPASVTLLNFYVLPDGTAVSDFSEELSSNMPSGILSEWMAVQSVTKTLEANVPGLVRLKILIHGQEAETLAGHVDLTGFFDLHSASSQPAGAAPAVQKPAASR
jgi:spore germination protein GerM